MKQLLFFSLLLAAITVAAQPAAPSGALNRVTASAGNHVRNGGYQLSWTVGEPVTTTLIAGNSMLTQGFHQPNDLATRIAVISPSVSGLEAFPNPASDRITISVKTATATGKLQLKLYDAAGRPVQVPVDTQEGSMQHVFRADLSGLPAGIYLATIYDRNGPAGTLKISKVY